MTGACSPPGWPSPDPTVASDLAVAFARSGRKVALVDLDARAPNVGKVFGIEGSFGLVDVVLGRENLERVLIPISWAGVPGGRPTVALAGATRGTAEPQPDSDPSRGAAVGQLDVLTLGTRRPHDPADFVGSNAVRQVIADLAAELRRICGENGVLVDRG